jgi:hypothetical protein
MKRFANLMLLAAGLTGCATAQMTVPPEVAKDTDVIAATDRSSATGLFVDESFKLGKLSIDEVDRDWDSTSSVGVLAFSGERTSGGYSYVVKGNGAALKGGCMTEGSAKSFSMGSGMSIGKESAKLGCTCGDESTPITVVVEASTTKKYEGELTVADNRYKVTAIYESDGMLSNGQPTGYRLDTGEGQARGAVEVLKPGRVWFPKDMDDAERNQIACLYIGLMLYLPPDDN